MENFCDVILTTNFHWRNLYDGHKNDVICLWRHDLLKFYCVILSFKTTLAISRNFRLLRHKKDQNYPIFFLNFYLAKGGIQPLSPSWLPLDVNTSVQKVYLFNQYLCQPVSKIKTEVTRYALLCVFNLVLFMSN